MNHKTRDEGNTSAGRSARSTGGILTSIGQESYHGQRFDFKSDGMNIPYNALRAAKERKAE